MLTATSMDIAERGAKKIGLLRETGTKLAFF
jgi:hypothetical protein